MTRWLLALFAERHDNLLDFLLLVGVVVLLLPLALFVDLIVSTVRAWWLRWLFTRTHVRCPNGHEVEAQGTWQCVCSLTYQGSGFAPCPHCGNAAHAILCPCGAPVVNPLTPMDE